MKWEDMLPRVQPFVAGCPRDLALRHLIDAARDFASRTRVWQFQATTILTVSGVDSYTFQLGPGQELVALLLCEVDSDDYDIVQGPQGRQRARRGDCRLCIPTGPQDFQLTPVPTQDGLSIITELAVRPDLAGTGKWPDDLDENVTDIVHGALSSLLMVPNSTWHDNAQGAVEAGHFEDRIAAVKAKVDRNYGRRSRRNPRYF